MDSISAIPQQPQLGRLAQFLRSLESERPEFLPRQLDVMGLIRQLALPSASTVENLSYGNLPFTMPPAGTGAAIPQVKTGRKPEVADLVGMLGGVPGMGAVADVGTKLSNEAADAIVRAITRNPEATAQRVIQETSMPFMQAVAPRMPSLLETPVKSDLGFYSALEQATMPLQNKGTGTQFLAQIEKTAGVKPEEVKWTGLDEFLKSRQNVTKQEVQDYLAANRVNLQEVRLGEGLPAGFTVRQNPIGDFNVLDLEGRIAGSGLNRAEAIASAGFPGTRTKFSSYTLPGGENYREILLTLPDTKGAKLDARRAEIEAKGLNATDAEKQEWASIMNQLQPETRDVENLPRFRNRPEFRSSHFDQPNILAHMRVNDRVVDGKKTLFIEEIQSDWHQAGRKKGYADKDKPWELFDPRDAKIYGRFATQEEARAAKAALPEEQSYFDIDKSEGVPDAPFKTTWHELTLKRAIQEASEKGYDRIAFTTGKTQAERYDLSKQIDEINVVGRTNALTGEQTKSVALDTTNGQSFRLGVNKDGVVDNVNDENISNFIGKSLDEIIGKDLAKKVMDGGSQTISGEGLKVGGEGMKGFYDQILPKSLEKLGKKFDAKVTKSVLPDEREFAKFEVVENGQVVWTAGSKSDAQKIANLGENRTIRPASEGPEIWVMDITPKMRESVLTKGQPLFAATPAIPAAGLLGDEGE